MAITPISWVTQLRVTNTNGFTASLNGNGVTAQTNADGHPDDPLVPTTAAGTLLSYGNVITPGDIAFLNTDPTNFVEVGVQVAGVFYPACKVLPGRVEKMYVPDGAVQLYARANTASVRLQYLLLDR